MIPASELSQLQSDAVAAACSLPCTIQRKTITKDNLGQTTEVWNTVATCNVGMAQPTAGQLANYNYRVEDLATWQVKFPVGTNVLPQDQLLITGQFLQQALIVQIVLEPRSYPVLLTVLASELKP